MRFIIDSKSWKSALSRCADILAKKPTGGILDNIRVACDNRGSLSFAGTDGLRRLDLRLQAKTEEQGAIFVPGDLASAQAGTMEGEVLAFTDDSDLSMDDGNGLQKVRLAKFDANTFPVGEEGGLERCSFPIEGAVLANMVKFCEPAAGFFRATAGIGSVMVEGLTFDLILKNEINDLGLVAMSSGHASFAQHVLESAAVAAPAADPGSMGNRFVASIGTDSTKAILAVCKEHPGEMRAVFTAGRGRLEADGFRYTFPLLAAQLNFPWRDSEQVVPRAGKASATVDAKLFMQAIDRALACLKGEDDSMKAMNVTIAHDKIHIAARSSRGNGQGTCPVEDFKGENQFMFRISGTYLMQHLKAFGEGPIKIAAAANVSLRRDHAAASIATITESGLSSR